MKFSVSVPVREAKPKPVIGKPYTSTVSFADWDPEYKSGEAYLLKYDLFDQEGNCLTWQEVFFAPKKGRKTPSRTSAFLSYLDALGINNFEDLVGLEESVIFRKVVSGNRAMLSIVERTCGDISLKDFEHNE